ncbi:MAG: UDP-3-O-(3-hydroxymyristoyl)glucosamine N-acyltransferase [Steroidobacteraceae bacterium]|nr:UDP-3-O-(3-hydroxymyristoyl)glucosamine N-acyltransferase [Steroidobacteraceae bacterium]
MSLTLGELAVRFGCGLHGDPDVRVDSVAALSNAHPGSVTFLANPRHRPRLAGTRASAVVLEASAVAECPVAALVAVNPHATFARIAALLHPRPAAPPGIHPSALVSPEARVDPEAHIGAFVSIGPRTVIGPRAVIGPHCVVEDGVEIAEDVHLVARVTVCHNVKIGARTLVHPGAVIGSDGFGFAREGERWLKVPQVGGVVIGADVEIGANTTIDRGAIGDTVLADGVKLDNHIQIGHNCVIGAHTAMAAHVGVSGSVTIGQRCMLAGKVGVVGHLTICDDVTVTGYTMVSHSIRHPGVYSGGIPAEDARTWRRLVGRFKRLDSLVRRVAAVERATGTRSTVHQGEDDD